MYKIIFLLMLLVGCIDKTIIQQHGNCTVIDTTEGALIECPDGSSQIVYDGQKGDQGITGPTGPQGETGEPGLASFIVDYIDPCGDDLGEPDEILFVLNDGKMCAWYLNIGLVILTDGSYRTTDKQKCNFTISNNGTVFND